MVEYEYALDDEENAVFIEDAIPKKMYRCPDCNSEMIPRKGDIRTNHYSHKNIELHKSINETPLHYNTKWFIHNLIKDSLQNKRRIYNEIMCPKQDIYSIYKYIPYGIFETHQIEHNVEWYFPENHILKPIDIFFDYYVTDGIDNLDVEKKDQKFIPDVSLLKNDKLIKAIEIVHTHDDSNEKTDYYRDNKIDVIKIKVQSEDDLESIRRTKRFIKNKFVEIVLNRHGCNLPIITTKKMIIDNIQCREKIKRIQPILDELKNIKYEYGELQLLSNDLLNDYMKLQTQISNKIKKNKEIHLHHDEYEKMSPIIEAVTNIFNDIELNEYDSLWTIAGICRNCKGDSFILKRNALSRLIDSGFIICDEKGYQIHNTDIPSAFYRNIFYSIHNGW